MSLVRLPQIPARTKGPRRACAGALSLLIGVLGLGTAAEARAETDGPTPQAVAYGFDWVEDLRPDELAARRPVVCVVDAGVAVTPDTPADDPAGPVVRRSTVDRDGGDPLPAPGQDHGTYMAAAMAGARNGWGSVGMHPRGRVISVRATTGASGLVEPPDYRRGISRCRELAAKSRLVAINLSLGSSREPTAAEEALLTEEVARAGDDGVAVVAAAGNRAGGATEFPARVPGVTAVAAGDAGGRPCPSATVDGRVDLLAAGCGIAEPDLLTGAERFSDRGGSSHASALVTMAIAVVADLSDLDGAAARDALIAHAATGDGPRRLDVRAAAGRPPPGAAAAPVAQAPEPPLPEPSGASPREEVVASPARARPRPRLTATLRGRRLQIRLSNWPPGAVRLRVLAPRREFGEAVVRRLSTRRRSLALSVRRRARMAVSASGPGAVRLRRRVSILGTM